MLLIQYLQIIVSMLISGGIAVRMSEDIYKTRKIQKNRNGLLELNWIIPTWGSWCKFLKNFYTRLFQEFPHQR